MYLLIHYKFTNVPNVEKVFHGQVYASLELTSFNFSIYLMFIYLRESRNFHALDTDTNYYFSSPKKKDIPVIFHISHHSDVDELPFSITHIVG